MVVSLRPVGEQVMVVTGVANEVGLVTARVAAKRGARLVLAAGEEAALRELTDEIRAAGGKAAYAVADVSRHEEVARIARVALSEFGGFDTWVSNAVTSIAGAPWTGSVEDMYRIFDTAFWGLVHGSLEAVRHFRQTGTPGAVINVGGFLGDRATPQRGDPVRAVYTGAKNAARGFTEALRVELAAEDAPVSVSLIQPSKMIDAPGAVAKAILYAAAHPKPELHVQSRAGLRAGFSNAAPRLADRIMRPHPVLRNAAIAGLVLVLATRRARAGGRS